MGGQIISHTKVNLNTELKGQSVYNEFHSYTNLKITTFKQLIYVKLQIIIITQNETFDIVYKIHTKG